MKEKRDFVKRENLKMKKIPDGFRGAFRTDDDARDVYSEAAGIARSVPRAVAVPRDVDDLVSAHALGEESARCR